MANCGFNGTIACVDLTRGEVLEEHPEETFYREFIGGSALGAFYVLRDMPAGADPLGPENVLVIAPSVLTGAPISGLSRFTMTTKSPLTGGLGEAQCGGYWGPQLKYAGYDALVIKGHSPDPVYLYVTNRGIEFRKARHLVDFFEKETEMAIREELGDAKAEVLQNGPAGRRLVRFANAGNRLHHFAGRLGIGAVMGSKNLLAIACRGRRTYAYADEEQVRALAKRSVERYGAADEYKAFTRFGTATGVEENVAIGGLPTRNMSRGVFEGHGAIDSEALRRELVRGNETCYACAVRCKRVVAAQDPWAIDAAYGGPEYETIAMFGPNLEIGDIRAVAKANELCNAYGLDTISTGGIVAFAMECYENGIISSSDADGLELRFGNAEALLGLITMIGERRGIGRLLGEGFDAAVAAFGPASAQFAMHVKGLAMPAHMPQVKKSLALAYAVSPLGADHLSSEHDGLLDACPIECQALDLAEGRPLKVMDRQKTRYVVYTHLYYSMLDTLCLCAFCFGPGSLHSYRDLEDIVEAVTGFPGNLWYLMKVGERRANLARAINYREGVGPQADKLPERMFAPLPDGVAKGQRVCRGEFTRAVRDFYGMMGWDPRTGRPRRGKLLELGLDWLDKVLNLGASGD